MAADVATPTFGASDEELWGRIAESNQVPLHEDGAGALRLGQVLEIP